MTPNSSSGGGSELYDRILTPGLFARAASGGKWRMARHLAYLDRKVHSAIVRGGARIVITMPPRHGKSEYISKYVPPWFLGTYPDRRVILTAYGDKFASSWGRKCRAILKATGSWFLESPEIASDSRAANRWDLKGRDGGMQTAGVNGEITGKGAHLLVVDDPIKNAKEALSLVYRESLWEWWIGTAYNRLEPDASVIVMHTRWHQDDLVGRLLRQAELGGEKWELINFPAIAEEHDELGRRPGEALWPARYDESDLSRIRLASTEYYWAALYQQHPSPKSGGLFRESVFDQLIDASVAPMTWDDLIRFWDKAGSSSGRGDWTVGVLMGRKGSHIYVLDVVRRQIEPFDVEDLVSRTAKRDHDKYGLAVQTWVEQEPGSGGKLQAQSTQVRLKGLRVHAEPSKGKKAARAEPFSIALKSNEVFFVKGDWMREYIDEHLAFPLGRHDDQVDASSGAYNKLILPGYIHPNRQAIIQAITLKGPAKPEHGYSIAVGAVEYSQTQDYAAFVVLGINLPTRRFGLLHCQRWDPGATANGKPLYPAGKIPLDLVLKHVVEKYKEFDLRGVSHDPKQCQRLGIDLANEGLNAPFFESNPKHRKALAETVLEVVSSKSCDFYNSGDAETLIEQVADLQIKESTDGFILDPEACGSYPELGVAFAVACWWAKAVMADELSS